MQKRFGSCFLGRTFRLLAWLRLVPPCAVHGIGLDAQVRLQIAGPESAGAVDFFQLRLLSTSSGGRSLMVMRAMVLLRLARMYHFP